MGLFGGFPREFGSPKRWLIENKADLITEINKHNGIQPCYCTVYKFKKHDGKQCIYDTAVVNKVFFDFDSVNAFDDILKMEVYFSARGVKRAIVFSGRGYHYYIKCEKVYKNKRAVLRGFQEYISVKLQLTPDTNVFGDLARIARIPGSYNPKGKKFCIPIKLEWLDKGDEWIRERAQRPFNWFKWYGTKLEVITGHDAFMEPLMPELDGIEIKTDIHEQYENLSTTAKKMLSNSDLRWKDRGSLINYLFEQGYLPQEVIEILLEKLSPEKAKHAIQEEKQIWHLWRNRYRYVAPAWMYI